MQTTFSTDSRCDPPQAQPTALEDASASPDVQEISAVVVGENRAPTVEKTISCVSCRRRKLKCDRIKPKCGTCSRLRHDCEYPERKRNLGTKRRNMKQLEARLAEVETKLVSESKASQSRSTERKASGYAEHDWNAAANSANLDGHDPNGYDSDEQNWSESDKVHKPTSTMHLTDFSSHEIVSLGLQEPLPAEAIQRELFDVYFDVVYPEAPMMHIPRFYAALALGPNLRPPVCLRYVMWALAAAASPKYENFAEVFYERARKYIEAAEMKGHGESFITVYHAMCWNLIAFFEAKRTYFTRAWMSTGRCTRLSQMMGLYRLDSPGLEVKRILPEPRDWIELEERRRTFWAAFYSDRWASSGTGWPMTITESDILTNLPSSEEAYAQGIEEPGVTLSSVLSGGGASNLSPFGGVVLAAALFGHNFAHIHGGLNENPDDVANGAFWKRHRDMDNTLSNTFLYLPESLRLPHGLQDMNVVFLNMNLHTSTICLHQAAILTAEKYALEPIVKQQSIMRCIRASEEIASIMRMICHLDTTKMNSWMGFCLYVAGGVFVHDIKLGQPSAPNSATNLDFILAAMRQIGKRHTITDHFTAQLEFDIEAAGILSSIPRYAKQMAQMGVVTAGSPYGSDSPSSNNTSRDRQTSFGQPHIRDHTRHVGTMPQPPLAGIISYDKYDPFFEANDQSTPDHDPPSRFFITAQKPNKYQQDRPTPANNVNLSSRALGLVQTNSYDAYVEAKAKEHPGGTDEASESSTRQSSNKAGRKWPEGASVVPWIAEAPNDCLTPKPNQQESKQGMLFFGVQNTGEHSRQDPLRSIDQPQQDSTVVGNSIQQLPIRESDSRKSPDYQGWDVQDPNPYSFDPSWQFDMMTDPNMQASLPLEGEGVREFIHNFGLTDWNSNAG
ncbi:hypothetical protein BP6252_12578 [Coleophoma cylindrospora]|uniref:Zn(2)-C6 fungal-type domain-containing protein n=1 Tax=Coleophoma cylindrospora TaxID=1849047 RepID=A0A3D8QCM6_9HELO|nr:hypothetical protein BP6252_12578 [Coleophoma cylindrospora]